MQRKTNEAKISEETTAEAEKKAESAISPERLEALVQQQYEGVFSKEYPFFGWADGYLFYIIRGGLLNFTISTDEFIQVTKKLCPNNDNYLDLGAGSGNVIEHARTKLRTNAYGIVAPGTVDPTRLTKCPFLIEGNIQYLEKIPEIREKTFAGIFSHYALIYLVHPQQAAEDSYRMLADNGLIAFQALRFPGLDYQQHQLIVADLINKGHDVAISIDKDLVGSGDRGVSFATIFIKKNPLLPELHFPIEIADEKNGVIIYRLNKELQTQPLLDKEEELTLYLKSLVRLHQWGFKLPRPVLEQLGQDLPKIGIKPVEALFGSDKETFYYNVSGLRVAESKLSFWEQKPTRDSSSVQDQKAIFDFGNLKFKIFSPSDRYLSVDISGLIINHKQYNKSLVICDTANQWSSVYQSDTAKIVSYIFELIKHEKNKENIFWQRDELIKALQAQIGIFLMPALCAFQHVLETTSKRNCR